MLFVVRPIISSCVVPLESVWYHLKVSGVLSIPVSLQFPMARYNFIVGIMANDELKEARWCSG